MLHDFGIKRARPEILVAGTALPRVRDATIHRTTMLDPIDVTTVRRIPCTTPARTAFDLGGVLPWPIDEELLQVAVIARRLDPVDLVAVLDRLGGRGRPGTVKLRLFLQEAVPDERPRRSSSPEPCRERLLSNRNATRFRKRTAVVQPTRAERRKESSSVRRRTRERAVGSTPRARETSTSVATPITVE
jgi:hypothetical protein